MIYSRGKEIETLNGEQKKKKLNPCDLEALRIRKYSSLKKQ